MAAVLDGVELLTEEYDGLRALSYHEAGHAAAGYVLGRSVNRVVVTPQEAAGFVETENRSREPLTLEDSRKTAIIDLAGVAAVAVRCRRPPRSGQPRPSWASDDAWHVLEAITQIERAWTSDWRQCVELAFVEARIAARKDSAVDVRKAAAAFIDVAKRDTASVCTTSRFKVLVSHLAGVLLREDCELGTHRAELELERADREFQSRPRPPVAANRRPAAPSPRGSAPPPLELTAGRYGAGAALAAALLGHGFRGRNRLRGVV
jgi:hypothetical protein